MSQETTDNEAIVHSMEGSAPIFHVVLVEPEIPQNTGNIARLCVAARCALHLVEPLGFQLDKASVRRAGTGHWDQVQLQRHPDLASCLRFLPPSTEVFYFSARVGRCYTDAVFPRGCAFVFGRESTGLPKSVLQQQDRCLNIPVLDSRVRSLNLSNAAAVVVYEGIRQLGVKAVQ